MPRRLFTFAGLLFSTALLAGSAMPTLSAKSPDAAAPLDAPAGPVFRVATVDELYLAVDRLQSGTTIVLEQGTYYLHRPIVIPEGLTQVALRGATGQWDDVVLQGNGMNDDSVQHGIMIGKSDRVLIADITIRDVYNHGVTIDFAASRPHVYHCRMLDTGEQFVKSNFNDAVGGADGGIVEYCLIEYSDWGPDDGYTQGVDVHGGTGWIIRHNLFRNIRTPPGAENTAVPSVLVWNGSADTLCEGNTFVDCDRAIALGLVQRKGYADHTGGIVRNNFITSRPDAVPNQDCGIHVHSAGAIVVHNTVLQNGGYPNAIEVRWPGASSIVHNNLTDGKITDRDGANMDLKGNAVIGDLTFRGPKTGDLHRAGDIRAVPFHEKCLTDWDGQKRSSWTAPGADK